jgi:hypothetical protein
MSIGRGIQNYHFVRHYHDGVYPSAKGFYVLTVPGQLPGSQVVYSLHEVPSNQALLHEPAMWRQIAQSSGFSWRLDPWQFATSRQEEAAWMDLRQISVPWPVSLIFGNFPLSSV